MKRFLVLLIILFTMQGVHAQTTTVYIVRHGEKDLSKPTDRNPPLSNAGAQRAADLAALLEKASIAAVFSTPYRRTMDTGMPTAASRKLEIRSYDAGKPSELVTRILEEFKGRTVLVVGHSNTILEMAEAFGVPKPLKPLTEEDYDNLIKVMIINGKPEATVSKYGARHHSEN